MYKTLDQKRAAFALEQISQLKAESRAEDRKLLGEVRLEIEAMPAALVVNGLLPVLLAFRAETPEKARGVVLGIYAKWMIEEECPVGWEQRPSANELIPRLAEESNVVHCQALEESLKYVNWLKHWAKALLEKPN